MIQNQIITFGCRLNIYESEVMKDLATQAGLQNTIIINTCAVTSEAERQARQEIRKLKKEHPEKKIFVTGCGAQINPDQFAQMEEVDRVIGNHEKLNLKAYQSNERLQVNDIMSVKETAGHLVAGFEGKSRAFVQIQNGCNHRCTFCTIPFGRGNSRSVPLTDIIQQVEHLLENGYQEIVLTGVDITDYGSSFEKNLPLGNMIEQLFKAVPSLKRLRLSSLDAVEIDNTLWDLIADERIMPHLHLSLQAGDNMILKRMKRRHLREDALNFCKKARSLRSDIVFGADIIAGFPTETDEMFENTRRFIEEADLTYLHVFPYSPRPGTPAARMPQVDGKTKKERASILRHEGIEAIKRYFDRIQNTTQNVLIESIDSGKILGKTDHFSPIELVTDHHIENGSYQKARIFNHQNGRLLGVVL